MEDYEQFLQSANLVLDRSGNTPSILKGLGGVGAETIRLFRSSYMKNLGSDGEGYIGLRALNLDELDACREPLRQDEGREDAPVPSGTDPEAAK